MKLTKNEVNRISKLYGLGKVKKFKQIKEGIINYNFIFDTEKGSYIIRILEKESKLKQREKEFKVLNYLNSHNFPYQVPIPIKNRNKEYLSRVNGKNLWAYQKIEGENTKRLNKEKLKEIAKALALLQIYLKKIKIKDKEDKLFENNWLLRKYKKMSKVKPKNKVDRLILKNIGFFTDLVKRLDKINFQENVQWIHSDFHKDNVLFRRNKIIAVLDFDNIHRATKIIETAHTVLECCFNRSKLNRRKLNIFLKAYNKINPLTKKEKNILIPAILRYQAVDFWWFYWGMKKTPEIRYSSLFRSIKLTKNLEKKWLIS